ncbi:MAG TPA: universal stress protein [Steroidobacteraceae bacterium]|nr:universal stress protein [Steroidobacteraceae bacterium]
MSAIRRILVAVKDPRAGSLPAVTKAAQLAHALNAELRLFHARSEPLYVDVAQANGHDLAEVEHTALAEPSRRLEALARPIRQRGVAVSCRVDWDYPAYEAVIRAAQRFKADLIVAERHLKAHRFAWLLHFTDFELLRLATVPVLLVKTPQPYRRPRILAAVDPSHAYSKPMGLDREILRPAVLLSQALHGKLHAVHAFDPLPIGQLPEGLALADVAQKIEAAAESKASKRLAHVLAGADIPVSRRHMLARHPIDAIEQVANDIGSDIVVMGAVSRSGLGRLIIGNTAERVLDRLPCDVLIVKPRRFASRIPRARRGPQIVAVSPIQTGV